LNTRECVLFPGDGFAYSHLPRGRSCGPPRRRSGLARSAGTCRRRSRNLALFWNQVRRYEWRTAIGSTISSNGSGVKTIAPTHGLPIPDVKATVPKVQAGLKAPHMMPESGTNEKCADRRWCSGAGGLKHEDDSLQRGPRGSLLSRDLVVAGDHVAPELDLALEQRAPRPQAFPRRAGIGPCRCRQRSFEPWHRRAQRRSAEFSRSTIGRGVPAGASSNVPEIEIEILVTELAHGSAGPASRRTVPADDGVGFELSALTRARRPRPLSSSKSTWPANRSTKRWDLRHDKGTA